MNKSFNKNVLCHTINESQKKDYTHLYEGKLRSSKDESSITLFINIWSNRFNLYSQSDMNHEKNFFKRYKYLIEATS